MVKRKIPAATTGTRKQEIMGSAVRVITRGSLTTWSIDAVAREARCAKGLVIHYFRGRGPLLAALGAELGAAREKEWLGALAGAGIADLDALWEVIRRGAADGSARALLELRLAGVPASGLTVGAAARLRTALALALETTADELPSAAALEGILEGYLLALLAAAEEAQVREAFFRYWLSYVG